MLLAPRDIVKATLVKTAIFVTDDRDAETLFLESTRVFAVRSHHMMVLP